MRVLIWHGTLSYDVVVSFMRCFDLKLFCLLPVLSVAGDFDFVFKQTFLQFVNTTDDDISLTIEESCLPVLDQTHTHLIGRGSSLVVEYDATVANCLLLLPSEKGLGVQSSLFVVDSLSKQYDLKARLDTCPITISGLDDRRHLYQLSSSCVSIKR